MKIVKAPESDSQATARILAEIQDAVYEQIEEEGIFPNEPHLLRMLNTIVVERIAEEAASYTARCHASTVLMSLN